MKTLRIPAVAALGSAPVTAQAAEMTLYENLGFGGRELTFRGYPPDINRTGFNDKASSIAARSGNWEVCTDADCKGFCASLAPGDYPVLDLRGLDNAVSSLRRVNWALRIMLRLSSRRCAGIRNGCRSGECKKRSSSNVRWRTDRIRRKADHVFECLTSSPLNTCSAGP
jgi:hypothetical protein